jgi:hypothetical protein
MYDSHLLEHTWMQNKERQAAISDPASIPPAVMEMV